MSLSEDSPAKTRAGQRLPSPWPGTALISIMGACQQARCFLQLSAAQPGNWTGQRLWHSPNPADVDPEGPTANPNTPPTPPPQKKQGKQPLPCPACCLLAQDLCLHCHTRGQRQERGRSIESPKGDTCLQELNTGDCNVTSV